MPLAVTLASKGVFEAFHSQEKVDALLHGHSYSGYAIGCGVAVEALKIYTDPLRNPALCSPKNWYVALPHAKGHRANLAGN